MKQINNLIVITLCVSILGFFANWAQNDYGMTTIAYCMLVCGTLLFSKCFLLIKHLRAASLFFLIAMASYLFLIVFNNYPGPEIIFSLLAVLALFCPIFLVPLIIKKTELKAERKTDFISYFFQFFLAMFCIANYFKLSHLGGAGVLLVLSGLIIFPAFMEAILSFKQGIYERKLILFVQSMIYLVIGLVVLAFIFMLQHWPGGKIFVYISTTLLLFAFIIILLGKIKGDILLQWWKSLDGVVKTTFISFVITLSYYYLSRNNVAPKMYSNNYPPTLQEIVSKSNDITQEGREYLERADVYTSNYFNFLDHRKEVENKNYKDAANK
jgi:hypothetical protein